jgi:DnaK suppressor protein
MKKKPYNPLQDSVYMSPRMKRYFERLLKQQLMELQKKEDVFAANLVDAHEQEADVIDQSSVMSTVLNDTAAYKHYHQQRQFIKAALRRLRDGYYGYCLETGEPIGVKRLLAVPYAFLCVDAQENQERRYAKS